MNLLDVETKQLIKNFQKRKKSTKGFTQSKTHSKSLKSFYSNEISINQKAHASRVSTLNIASSKDS